MLANSILVKKLFLHFPQQVRLRLLRHRRRLRWSGEREGGGRPRGEGRAGGLRQTFSSGHDLGHRRHAAMWAEASRAARGRRLCLLAEALPGAESGKRHGGGRGHGTQGARLRRGGRRPQGAAIAELLPRECDAAQDARAGGGAQRRLEVRVARESDRLDVVAIGARVEVEDRHADHRVAWQLEGGA